MPRGTSAGSRCLQQGVAGVEVTKRDVELELAAEASPLPACRSCSSPATRPNSEELGTPRSRGEGSLRCGARARALPQA
eukprot:CAMPEP_0182817116 /NCGR_PEP_ID=MMETSP0006_2-20121128/11300_1 /TAXON_ID=97485 /ORGANISM="Prymnesium parvum, Strain Texoma1" /LENGTH=78 /DNA_ID=CAMNT_0024943455 /DNA_START=1039 /DNA_END=1275 /DNA_ORIENTATION=-